MSSIHFELGFGCSAFSKVSRFQVQCQLDVQAFFSACIPIISDAKGFCNLCSSPVFSTWTLPLCACFRPSVSVLMLLLDGMLISGTLGLCSLQLQAVLVLHVGGGV